MSLGEPPSAIGIGIEGCVCVVSVKGVGWVEGVMDVSYVALLRSLVSSFVFSFVLRVLVSTPFYSTSGFQCARAWVGGMEHMFY